LALSFGLSPGPAPDGSSSSEIADPLLAESYTVRVYGNFPGDHKARRLADNKRFTENQIRSEVVYADAIKGNAIEHVAPGAALQLAAR